MKIVVAGTGYVGLVTGVALAHIGHNVSCVDVDEAKIDKLNEGICPIYEEGLEELMKESKERLTFTIDAKREYKNADAIFIAVGTPERSDGSANLDYVYSVCDDIAEALERDCVVVVKSTVPVGTNDKIEEYLNREVKDGISVSVASNPEFLAQGTAVYNTLHASRIVVGVENEYSKKVMEKIYKPLTMGEYNIPYLCMNRKSAEMVKYASNNFLALKISFINEVSNFCELIGADITDVTKGMSFDDRIGNKFLNSGIGYGGSCFPKDTKALYSLANKYDMDFKTIRACIDVNTNQKLYLFYKLEKEYGDNLRGMNVAVLGVTFKKGTDDLREAPSIDNVKALLDYGVNVSVYDPVGLDNFKKLFGEKVDYYTDIDECINKKDLVMIMTEWDEIVKYDVNKFVELMETPIIYDGRNCYSLNSMKDKKLRYVSIGREEINNL